MDVDGHIMQRNWKGVWLWLIEGKIIYSHLNNQIISYETKVVFPESTTLC